MVFPRKAAPPAGANVARMITIGSEPIVPVSDLSQLDNVTEATPGGTVGSPVSEGNPDSSDLHIDPSNIRIEGLPPGPPQGGQPEGQPPIVAGDDEIDDDRFRGKSKKEIYASFKNLETEKGRLANEIGNYRQTFDRLILNQTKDVQQSAPAPVDEAELLSQLLTNPSKVLNNIEQRVIGQFRQQESMNLVNQIKQENNSLISDPNFIPFLKTVPRNILSQIDSDPSQLMFIINQYKAISNAPPTPGLPASAPRDIRVGVAAGTGNTAKIPARTWTRSEIRNMVTNNPGEYRRRQDEIRRAYAEGQVDLNK